MIYGMDFLLVNLSLGLRLFQYPTSCSGRLEALLNYDHHLCFVLDLAEQGGHRDQYMHSTLWRAPKQMSKMSCECDVGF